MITVTLFQICLMSVLTMTIGICFGFYIQKASDKMSKESQELWVRTLCQLHETVIHKHLEFFQDNILREFLQAQEEAATYAVDDDAFLEEEEEEDGGEDDAETKELKNKKGNDWIN